MINEENLNKMYEGIIEKHELTTKELNSYGFNAKDLSELVGGGVLKRIRRGYYELCSIDSLIRYTKKLIENQEYDKVTRCFEVCFSINPNHYYSTLQLFLRAIRQKDYLKALEYWDYLMNTNDPFYRKDNNFYIYLLNMIVELPEKYKNYAKNLKLGDIQVSKDKQNGHIEKEDKIRISVYNQRFTLALRQLKETTLENKKTTVQDIVLKNLLNQAKEEQINKKIKILDYIEKEQYEEIIGYLEDLELRHLLSQSNVYTLLLAKELCEFKKTHELPKTSKISSEDLFEAIDEKDYELAFELAKKWCQKNKIDFTQNEILILLSRIVEKINKVNNKKEEKENESEKEDNSIPNFVNIIQYLMKQDLENVYKTLKVYLNSIKKIEYEFLILDLIKISLIEQDIAFTKPMMVLTYLSQDSYTFDISEYVQNFYETLGQNRFEEARIYLNILSRAKELGQPCVFVANLETVLNRTEKLMQRNINTWNDLDNYSKKEEDCLKLDISLEEEKVEETQIIIEQIEEPKAEIPQVNIFSKRKNNTNAFNKEKIKKTYNDRELIEKKLKTLEENGIVILKPMEKERRAHIHETVNEFSNIISFSIGKEPSRKVVLRYYVPMFIKDIKDLFKKGNEFYRNYDYENSISCYRQLLQALHEPNMFVYSGLGRAYAKISKKDLAIDYLTVATELGKMQGDDLNFDDFISYLKGDVIEEDRKAYFKMNISEFEGDSIFIETPYIEEITEYVMNGVPVEEAINQFTLTSEERNIILLLFAKSYFSQGNVILGNKLIKKYEQSKEKTNSTKTFYQEILNNKKLYRNGVGDDYISYLIRTKHK